ncbi:hypothetical protein OG585_42745 [Streptomyces sp. NBC_01340]|nr:MULTISPECIES: hypothetical protein [unclassified Streptomyces]MCX4595283.1 hypothetical protein [Streptomyces sp. NBC_01549]WSI43274.1 hypothetical protein OG585_42745 [Streptomyces sp. NBC_01340]
MALVRDRLAATVLVALPLLLGAVASPTTASANPSNGRRPHGSGDGHH